MNSVVRTNEQSEERQHEDAKHRKRHDPRNYRRDSTRIQWRAEQHFTEQAAAVMLHSFTTKEITHTR
ncbi:MAG: hypothetical protein JKY60_04840 [Kordiimonadaceae bacterium]|nr:hypothetical protein [Kordiimonadaceae bacterium]